MKKLLFAVLTICLVSSQGYTASNKEDYESQEKCARDAKKRFDKEFKAESAAYYYPEFGEDGKQKTDEHGELKWRAGVYPFHYENHFNRRMNRCFMLIYTAPTDPLGQALFDVYEVRSLGHIAIVQFLSKEEQNNKGGKKEEVGCSTKGEKCSSVEDWAAFIKPYMEK